MSNILVKAKAIEDYLINIRRDLHRHPELSGLEHRTQEKISKELEKLGIPYEKVANSSIIATLKGKKSGKTIALRGDIDALPINEETDVEYKSQTQGVMHACGHDAHATMLLGAAKILSEMKDEIAGEVRFSFKKMKKHYRGQKELLKLEE